MDSQPTDDFATPKLQPVNADIPIEQDLENEGEQSTQPEIQEDQNDEPVEIAQVADSDAEDAVDSVKAQDSIEINETMVEALNLNEDATNPEAAYTADLDLDMSLDQASEEAQSQNQTSQHTSITQLITALTEAGDSAGLADALAATSSKEVYQKLQASVQNISKDNTASRENILSSGTQEKESQEFIDAAPEAVQEVTSKATRRQNAQKLDQQRKSLTTQLVQDTLAQDGSNQASIQGLDPSHPLLARVQAALRTQLTELNTQIDLELREKEEEASRLQAEHQNTGVRLYDLQLSLASIQDEVSQSSDNLITIKQLREESEADRKSAEESWRAETEKVKSGQARVGAQRLELEKLTKALNAVLLNADTVKANLSVVKREAENLEAQLMETEIAKRKQDLFIDSLQSQLLELQERERAFKKQSTTQASESAHAKNVLREAEQEMQVMRIEKRNLIQQWKRAVAGLQKKEEVVRAIENAIKTEKNTLMVMASELSSLRQIIRKTKDEHEVLSSLAERVTSQTEVVQANIEALAQERQNLAYSNAKYEKTLEKTEADMKVALRESKLLRSAITAIEKEVRKTQQDTKNLEDQAMDKAMQQMMVEKGNQGILKDGAKLRADLEEKNAQIVYCDNQIANLRLEQVDLQNRITAQNARMSEINSAMSRENALIEKSEIEIHKRTIELTKKQSEVDELNRKLGILLSRETDEALGPLEATIHNLTKSLSSKEAECVKLQNFWLKSQGELVYIMKNLEEVGGDTEDLKMRAQVLNRRKIHVNAQYEREERDIKDLQKSLRSLYHEQTKLNILVSKHSSLQQQLEENNIGLQKEFRAKIREAEIEALRLESLVATIQQEKDSNLEKIIETEQHILLWEKKIEIAKGTQAALDPNVGAAEHKALEGEIHRMQLRYMQLQKVQEKLISEMERAVYRREGASMSPIRTSKSSPTKSRNNATDMLKREITELTKRLKTVLRDIQEMDVDIESLDTARHRLAHQIETAQELVNQLVTTQSTLGTRLSELISERGRSLQLTQITFSRYKHYNALHTHSYQVVCSDSSKREPMLLKWRERNKAVALAVEKLGDVEAEGLDGVRELSSAVMSF